MNSAYEFADYEFAAFLLLDSSNIPLLSVAQMRVWQHALGSRQHEVDGYPLRYIMVESVYFAALSAVDLSTACERLQERFGLDPFATDVETEGEDWWIYAYTGRADLHFSLSRIGNFTNPTAWRWMWQAPENANYQIIVQCCEAQLRAIEAVLAEALECDVIRYPAGFRQV